MQILQRKDDFTSKRMNISPDYYDVTIDFKNIPKARGCADVTIEFSVKVHIKYMGRGLENVIEGEACRAF